MAQLKLCPFKAEPFTQLKLCRLKAKPFARINADNAGKRGLREQTSKPILTTGPSIRVPGISRTPVLVTEAFPEVFVSHHGFMLRSPMGINAVPAVPSENVTAFRTLAGSFNRDSLFATTASSAHSSASSVYS